VTAGAVGEIDGEFPLGPCGDQMEQGKSKEQACHETEESTLPAHTTG